MNGRKRATKSPEGWGRVGRQRSVMDLLDYLIGALLAAWAVSESGIGLLSFLNQWRGRAARRDRFSFLVIWLAIVPPLGFAILVRRQLVLSDGFGSFAALAPLLGYLGCLCVVVGLTIRLAAVATLRRQFTTTVAIVEQHALVDTGLYRVIRHPAYLGLLVALLGFGLASGNGVSLATLVVLPLVATLYRIRVEERLLLRHFGLAYQAYARRTYRLLPGIY